MAPGGGLGLLLALVVAASAVSGLVSPRHGMPSHRFRRLGQVRQMASMSIPEPKKIIIAGAPASGKGTQCEMIKEKYGVVHLSTGDILRAAVKEGTELGKTAQGFMDRGELVPDDVIIGVVRERLSQSDCEERGWLLDGYPRTAAQAKALLEDGHEPTSFVLLDVPDEMLVERVVGRRTDPETGKIYHMTFNPPESEEISERLVQRSDDTEEKIKVRVKAFHDNCDAVKSYFEPQLTRIEGTEAKATVFSAVSDAIMQGIQSDSDSDNDSSSSGSSSSGGGGAAAGARGGASALLESLTDNVVEEQREQRKLQKLGVDKVLNRQPETPAMAVEATSTPAASSSVSTTTSVAAFLGLDVVLHGSFQALGIGLPSSLVGMLGLFGALSVLEKSSPATAIKAASLFEPGAGFFGRWMPVFFVPSLVVLPLMTTPAAVDLFRLVVLISGGWALSVLSTATIIERFSAGSGSMQPPLGTTSPAPAKSPMSLTQIKALARTTWTTGIAAALAARISSSASNGPLQLAFTLSLTLLSYVKSSLAPANIKAVFHPVVISTAATMLGLRVFALASGTGFQSVLESYLSSTGFWGAGNVLTFLLGPSVISFGFEMFKRKKLMVENRKAVLAGCLGASVFGLFGTAMLSRLVMLSEGLRTATMSRQLTSPLAMSVADLLNADKSLAVSLVVLTGVLGANFGSRLMTRFQVRNPVSRGLTMGASAHGLGTAALAGTEPEAFAFSAIAMALVGACSTALVSLPPVRSALFGVAGIPAP